MLRLEIWSCSIGRYCMLHFQSHMIDVNLWISQGTITIANKVVTLGLIGIVKSQAPQWDSMGLQADPKIAHRQQPILSTSAKLHLKSSLYVQWKVGWSAKGFYLIHWGASSTQLWATTLSPNYDSVSRSTEPWTINESLPKYWNGRGSLLTWCARKMVVSTAYGCLLRSSSMVIQVCHHELGVSLGHEAPQELKVVATWMQAIEGNWLDSLIVQVSFGNRM